MAPHAAEPSVEVHCISVARLHGKTRNDLIGTSLGSGSCAPKSSDPFILETAELQRGGLVHH